MLPDDIKNWAAEQGYPEACALDRNGECTMCGRPCDEQMRKDCMEKTITDEYAEAHIPSSAIDAAGEQPTITQQDRDLYKRLLGLTQENFYNRQNGKPVVDALELMAKHRTTSLAAQDGLVEALEWYADRMCEGWCDKDPKSCEAIGSDNCSGCRAHVALSAIKGDKS